MHTQESGHKKESQNENKSIGANFSMVSCYTDTCSDTSFTSYNFVDKQTKY